jgi:hypothetical protein
LRTAPAVGCARGRAPIAIDVGLLAREPHRLAQAHRVHVTLESESSALAER